MNASESNPGADHLYRIYSEYLEMPGLRLTRAQAQRLCGVDAQTCVEVLQLLVDAGFLRVADGGQYVRVTDGPVAPSLRMAKAALMRMIGERLAG